MAYYYRKNVNDTANDVKLKMQIAALTLKLGENNDKTDDLLEVDKNIKKHVDDNYNISQINKIKSEFNTGLIDAHTNNIKSIDSQLLELKEQISDNNNLIGNNFTSILPLKSNYVIDNIWLFDLNFIKDINFTHDINEFLIYENDITYNFKINSFIELNESCLYTYDSLKNFYFILMIDGDKKVVSKQPFPSFPKVNSLQS